MPPTGTSRDAAARRGRHAAEQRRLRAGPVLARSSSSRSRSAGAWTTGATTTARNLETNVADRHCPTAASRTLPDRDDTVFSPRAAVLYRITNKVSAWGSLGSGFRAPTLNELYRQFRVGAVLTLANDQLGPGAARGRRAGPQRRAGREPHVPHHLVRQPDEEPGVQRHHRAQHAAAAEPGAHAHLGHPDGRRVPDRASTGASARATSSTPRRSRSSPPTRLLVGKYLPQVPKNRGSVSVAYSNARVATLSVSVLGFGRQFNEDLNNGVRAGRDRARPARLRHDGVLGPALDRPQPGRVLRRAERARQEYIVQLLPTTIGSPRLVNGGIRVRWSAQR